MAERPSEWHPEVLPEAWAKTTSNLAQRSLLAGFYLAGGTGVALQYGHRRSVDLDLFREAEFDSAVLRDRLRGQKGLARVALAQGTAHLTLHGVKVSFLHYPYPLLFPLRLYGNVEVADPRDIACMKIEAIASRGVRRDFVDLYVVAQEYGLRELFESFAKKYAAVSYSRTHILKALTYFRDAEEEPLPDMLIPLAWPAVTQFFVSETPRLARLR
ncbi:MAG: hypothetical protein GEV06_10330 [Luteitalea sp.]|nr:hypothetical protein [Luteitalea sp.]